MSNETTSRTDPDIDAPEFFTIKRIITWIVIGGFAIGLIGSLPWLVFYWTRDSWERYTEAASFWGSSYSFIGTIVSAMAFAGVIVTIMMQRHELRLQRRELQLTRDEMAATREQHARTATAQESSDQKLLLASYMNAIESLRQLNQWRLSQSEGVSSKPAAQALRNQLQIKKSLEIMVKDLEPEIAKTFPRISETSPVGSELDIIQKMFEIQTEYQAALEEIDITDFQKLRSGCYKLNKILEKIEPYKNAPVFCCGILRGIELPNEQSYKDMKIPGDHGFTSRYYFYEAYKQINSTLLRYISTIALGE